MSNLVEVLADRRLNNTAKTMAILSFLGGSAAVADIIQAGIENGARTIRAWNPGSLLSKAGARVSKLPTGWKLLPAGYAYLEKQGVIFSAVQPTASNDASFSDKPSRHRITICHGRSRVWRELKEFLRDHYEADVQEFNSRTVIGLSTKERLAELLRTTDIAFIVLTAEDELSDGTFHPRLNVAHEVGLFQGRLGFEGAAILLEEGCAEFSNIAGIGQIRFKRDALLSATEVLRQYLQSRGVQVIARAA